MNTFERAERFVALHQAGCFVIPNPWHRGSAVLLAGLGFQALASSSAGQALCQSRADGTLGRQATLAHLRDPVDAPPLPLNADQENGLGDLPQDCADIVRAAAALGVVGGSIEDASGRAEDPIYPFDMAVARVRATVAAARALPFPFMLTARAPKPVNVVMGLSGSSLGRPGASTMPLEPPRCPHSTPRSGPAARCRPSGRPASLPQCQGDHR